MGFFLRVAALAVLISTVVAGAPASGAVPTQRAATTTAAGVAKHHPQRMVTLLGLTIGAALTLIVAAAILSLLRAARRLIIGKELKHEKTPYVDAWKLAGKRLRPPTEKRNNDELSDSPDP